MVAWGEDNTRHTVGIVMYPTDRATTSQYLIRHEMPDISLHPHSFIYAVARLLQHAQRSKPTGHLPSLAGGIWLLKDPTLPR